MGTKPWLLFVIAIIRLTRFCDTAFTSDPGGRVIVQLFRWRFDDIARECTQFLAPKGYGGVEVAPVAEHIVNAGPIKWDEVYYPVSYKISSRSGDEDSFKDMVHRCNKAGIKVYVNVVLSHMVGFPNDANGYAGSTAKTAEYDYPAVPYSESDFNRPSCYVKNSEDKTQMRLCDRPYDHHLNHSSPDVRGKIRNFLNKLISYGVAGFSIDSVNRIDPDNLKTILSRLRYLNTSHGFDCESEPYIYQEYESAIVGEDVVAPEYYALGRLADYKYRISLVNAFSARTIVNSLVDDVFYGEYTLPKGKSLVFVDAPAVYRETAAPRITSAAPKEYIPAIAFMLAYPFGQPRILSGFNFQSEPPFVNREMENVKFDGINCTNGWTCEHRQRAILNMIKFREVVGDANVTNVWNRGFDNFSFSRGDKGFILFTGNYWYKHFKYTVQTGMPMGIYCDVITGEVKDNKCTGKTVSVNVAGNAYFERYYWEIGVTAIHIEAKLQ